jgi:lysozyme family protein
MAPCSLAGSGMLHAKEPHASRLHLVSCDRSSIHRWSSAGMLHAGKNSMHHASLNSSRSPTHRSFAMSFNDAFAKTVALEGGYVNDPLDPGGETKFGISKRSHPLIDIKNLTIDQAKEIYQNEYWFPIHLDQVSSARVASKIFDLAVNASPAKAVSVTQEALNLLTAPTHDPLLIDGKMGNLTLRMVNLFRTPESEAALVTAINGFMFVYYVTLCHNDPKFYRFINGWMKRLA